MIPGSYIFDRVICLPIDNSLTGWPDTVLSTDFVGTRHVIFAIFTGKGTSRNPKYCTCMTCYYYSVAGSYHREDRRELRFTSYSSLSSNQLGFFVSCCLSALNFRLLKT